MTNDRNDNPGQGQWSQDRRFNEEESAENDRRGIDNPELNSDQDSSFDKDRNFDTENEDEDQNDDFLTNGLDDDDDDDDLTDDEDEDEDDSLTDDEDYDDDPQQTKQNQQRTGSDTNSDYDRP